MEMQRKIEVVNLPTDSRRNRSPLGIDVSKRFIDEFVDASLRFAGRSGKPAIFTEPNSPLCGAARFASVTRTSSISSIRRGVASATFRPPTIAQPTPKNPPPPFAEAIPG